MTVKTKNSHPFDRREQPRKAAKHPHVKFELADPNELHIMVVVDHEAKIYKVTDKADIDAFLRKAHHTKDGRLYGIFVPGGRARVPGGTRVKLGDDGKPVIDKETGNPVMESYPERHVWIPASIAPQRAVIGPDGEQNMEHAVRGQLHRLLVPEDSVKDLELVLDRDDIPSYRVLSDSFDPQATRHI